MDELQRMLLEEVRNLRADIAERRQELRTQSACPVYIRPAEPEETPFEEIRITTDFSNTGLRFVTTQEDRYRKGMQLYMIPAVSHLNFEYLGEVVRMEPRSTGRCGIAVKLLRIGKPVVDDSTVGSSAFRAVDVLRLTETWMEVYPSLEQARFSKLGEVPSTTAASLKQRQA